MDLGFLPFRTLRNASDLHTLVVSRASLPLVKLAYELEPQALTDEVLQDAFCHGARTEVLRFLLDATKTRHDSGKVSEMIAKAFLAALPRLHYTSTPSGKEPLVLLHELIRGFPSALINEDPFDDENAYFCALNVVLFSERFPDEILDSMICSICTIPMGQKCLNLLDTDALKRYYGRWGYQHRMRTRLNDKGMEAVVKILAKVEEFTSHRENFTINEFSTLLPLLVKDSNATKRVHLDIDPYQITANTKPQLGELLAPVKEQLVGRRGPITEFSVQLCGRIIDGVCDSSFLNLLSSMKCLKRVDICLGYDWLGDVELCTSLCELLQLLPLETLIVQAPTKEEGLFMPLLAAVNKCSTSKYFALLSLENPEETKKYQAQMLTFLENNTRLAMAVFCDVSGTFILHRVCRLLKEHIRLDWSTDEKSSIEKRQIDYCTLLNQCGRGKARDTKHTTRKDIVDLLSLESIKERLDHLEFQDEKKEDQNQDFINNMQYGLLREAPPIWLPKEEQVSWAKGAPEIFPNKRKASQLSEPY